jgi:hypothetical protein
MLLKEAELRKSVWRGVLCRARAAGEVGVRGAKQPSGHTDLRTRRRSDTVPGPELAARSSRTAPRDGYDRRINLRQGEGAMPLIKPRTRGKQFVKHRTRLDRENNETLYAYAHFLGESTEYVLNQLIDTVLARDKEFVQWRTVHHSSFVPGSRAHGRRNESNRRTARQVATVSGEPATVAATR